MDEKRTAKKAYELEKIRELINRVEQSIIDVETQANKIEWVKLCFTLYFLKRSKSVASSSKDFTEYMAYDINGNTYEA